MKPPWVEGTEGWRYVVRDDLLPGGTKRRAVAPLFALGQEVVYAGPAQGMAQVALAHGSRESGVPCTVFVPRRQSPHPLTLEAARLGVRHVELRPGYLSQLQFRARAHAEAVSGLFLPLGLYHPLVLDALASAARQVRLTLGFDPPEVWCAAGGGALAHGLAEGFRQSEVVAMEVGRPIPADRRHGRVRWLRSALAFDQEAPKAESPPFPSSRTYDAKVWQAFCEQAPRGALFWNVAA